MININNLSFGYKKKTPLYRNLNLKLPSGSIYGLLGKNGAGKSTLLKNIAGLLFPTGGAISVNDFIPKKRSPSFLQTIYFIPEEVYVPALTVAAYKNLYAPFYPAFNDDEFHQHLKLLDVADKGKLNKFSFGQQKKFIIAFAMACNTKVLLLDEPTNGLDIPSKVKFRKLLTSVLSSDRTIFISTHQIRDLDNLIDSVIIIDNGELYLHATLSEISQKLSFKIMEELPNENDLLYGEPSLKGYSVVVRNKANEETKVNLEFLFNAVTENYDKVKIIFGKN